MKKPETIWVVAEVWRGLLTSVRAFRDSEMALTYERQVRQRINLVEDEVGVFEVLLDAESDDHNEFSKS